MRVRSASWRVALASSLMACSTPKKLLLLSAAARSPATITPYCAFREPLMDAGLESLGAVELHNGLAKAMGTRRCRLPITTASPAGETRCQSLSFFKHVSHIPAASHRGCSDSKMALTCVLRSQVRQRSGVLGRLCTQLPSLRLRLRRHLLQLYEHLLQTRLAHRYVVLRGAHTRGGQNRSGRSERRGGRSKSKGFGTRGVWLMRVPSAVCKQGGWRIFS